MKKRGNIRLGPEQQIVLLFLLGVIGGTVYGNLAEREMVSGGFSFLDIVDMDNRLLLHTVLGQRMAETFLLWIVGMTELSVFLVLFLAAGYGFVSGLILTVCVMGKGMTGILYFWGMTMPQYLVYVPVWYHMALWGYLKEGRVKWLGFVRALLLVFAAGIAEVFVNPWLMKFLTQILRS